MSGYVGPDKAISATKLDEIIKNAKFVKKIDDYKGRKEIKAAYIYSTKTRIGGKTVEIGMIVREHNDGKRYYDHFIPSKENHGKWKPPALA